MKKNLLLPILTIFLLFQINSIAQNPAQIKTIIEPNETVGFSYTLSPLASPLRFNNPMLGGQMPIYNLPSWGVLGDYSNVLTLTNSPMGEIAMCQAYQAQQDDTITLFFTGNGIFPPQYIIANQNQNGSIDTIMNMPDFINPDPHGVYVKDGIVYYASRVFGSFSFNGEVRNTIGEDIYSYDLNTGQSDTIFNWFENVPISMFVNDYWSEMWNGSRVDWSHFNWISMDWDGHLLVSWRHMGFTKIDRTTGEVVWWGGLPEGLAAAHGFNELACNNGDCRTRLNHHINPFPNKPGWYTIFDNGDSMRLESRGLVFSVEELDMFVEEEYFTEPSPFMGSMDIWEMDTNYVLINTPTIGEEIWFDSLQTWIADSTLIENLESRLLQSGSSIRLIERESQNTIGHWKTDSLNFVYSAEIREISNIASGIFENNIETFTVYPNPASEIIFLPTGAYKIYNMHGQLVMTAKGNTANIIELPLGLYHVISEEGFRASFIKKE